MDQTEMKDLAVQDIGPTGDRFKRILERAEFAPFLKLLSSTEMNQMTGREEEARSVAYKFEMNDGTEFFARYTRHGALHEYIPAGPAKRSQ